jgi:hypothetical protein
MVSGQRELPLWYWSEDEHNLERLFPDDPGMYWINSRILAHTVVEREASCVTSAKELQERVHAAISVIQRGGSRVTGPDRPCRVCGIGHYKDIRGGEPQFIGVLNKEQAEQLSQAEFIYKKGNQRVTVRLQACDTCGHVDFFQFADGVAPPAWKA